MATHLLLRAQAPNLMQSASFNCVLRHDHIPNLSRHLQTATASQKRANPLITIQKHSLSHSKFLNTLNKPFRNGFHSSPLSHSTRLVIPPPTTHPFKSTLLKRNPFSNFRLPNQHLKTLSQTQTSTSTSKITSDPLMAYWLLSTAALVFGMVVLGGATRLTRSGLSMVDWRPLGRLPPMSEEAWELEFNKYKQFPEYQRQNLHMSLDEFKFIFYMEWAHRTYGRLLGLVYGLPLVYFLASGRASQAGRVKSLTALFGIGAAQGLVGWWMVKSGLSHDLPKDKEVRVSPYRLTAHLAMAVTLFSGLLWTGWSTLHPQRLVTSGLAKGPFAWSHALSTIVLATMLTGGFVAGNDAGRAFNDWPLYAGNILPEKMWKPELGWRNFTENTSTVQFDHRTLAYTTLFTATGLAMSSTRAFNNGALPPASLSGARVVAGLAWAQAALGVATLITIVPVSLGAAHQGGALTVWTAALYTMHALRYARP